MTPAHKKRKATPAQIERKLRKLARRLAEYNTIISDAGARTLANGSDVFQEARQLIRLTGHDVEYRKRVSQILRVVKP